MLNLKGIKNLAIVAIAAAGLSMGLSACNGDSGFATSGSGVSLPAASTPEAALQKRNDIVLATNSYGEVITAEFEFECTGEVSGWKPLDAIDLKDPTEKAVNNKFMKLLLGLSESQKHQADEWRTNAMKSEMDKFKADMTYTPKACPAFQYAKNNPLGF